ncbi:hypothetical protein QFC22_002918 [Naganishia vaughanmartiniae]|uniref:Uncharacterized protein n=1 Tax=Naganishia vaughanmartiniae TaxID=1424756 RepID=A0ACC2X8R6_9TREE|nr:hypothetical protein QFC22_002918 [Naganishia vaughanmartiniae]
MSSEQQTKRKRECEAPQTGSVKQRRVSATPDSSTDQRGSKSNKDPSLSSWLNLPPPPPLPEPFFTASPVFDRDSIFIGYALPLSEPSTTTVKNYIARLPHDHPNLPDVVAGRTGSKADVSGNDAATKARAKIKPSHNMWAYKVRSLFAGPYDLTSVNSFCSRLSQQCLRKKHGTAGTSESDYEAITASSDDGEQYGGAHLLKVLNEEGTVDVLVVCSRWFGGTMLGPIRFHHIEKSARTALEGWSIKEKLVELRREVQGLDEVIADLRAELAPKSLEQGQITEEPHQDMPDTALPTMLARPPKSPSYQNVANVAQLERLIKAKTLTVQTLVNRVATQER